MASGSKRTLRIGAVGLLIACLLIALPIVLPRTTINRFIVAIGFIALCWSLSCLLNAAWDRWRERGKS